jgi:hypothetical protein
MAESNDTRAVAARLAEGQSVADQAILSALLGDRGRVWVPHRGWADGAAGVDSLLELSDELGGAALAIETVVAADDVVVVELLARPVSGVDARPVPITEVVRFDADAAITELLIYLDPVQLVGGTGVPADAAD